MHNEYKTYFSSTGSSYYDNVRPLAYPDSDAVLICFDISRPETLDSVIKKVSICFISPPRPSLSHLNSGRFFLFPDQHLVLTGTSVLGRLHFHGPVTGQMGTGLRQSSSWISLKCPWKFDRGHSEEWTVRMENVRRRISAGCVPDEYEMHNLASACILKTRGGDPSLES